jgi:hypothetical protein
VQDLVTRVAKLEGTGPLLDPDAANSSAPPDPSLLPKSSGEGAPGDAGQLLLAGKGILNKEGVLQHGPDLFPTKPFDEVLSLKTAHSSSSGLGSSTEGFVPRYFKLDFSRFNGKDDPLSWLSRCEQYFRAQKTETAHKIWLATFYLYGGAFH